MFFRYYKPARLKKETERAHCVTYTADPGASTAAAAAAAAGVRPGEMNTKYRTSIKIAKKDFMRQNHSQAYPSPKQKTM